ncbi:hypothetical protein HC031_06220 [Planosporangium thailandense]|uniref:Peptidase MA-like domain-containing protein n=1 Tax=Planosporangium thailandense TaxID=765197 RepID=A0ABX0XTH8_9ACTN|nr:hypothetical protein [Planosporangium thailandense]NJC69317.1 hypothetical protein [Planosporangium thailandense]
MTEEELDPARRPARTRLIRIGLGLAALSGLLGGSAVPTAGHDWRRPLDHRAAAVAAQAPSDGSGDGGPTGYQRASGTVAARAGSSRVYGRIQAVLDTQAAALLRGDEKAFLAPADPARMALVDDLRQRFTTLRAMSVAGWTEKLDGEPEPVEGGWRAQVRLGYCFVVSGCQPVTVPVSTRWAEHTGSPTLVEFGTSGTSDLGPRPWEVTDLRVAVGPRVVVAAAPRYADRVAEVLAAAEEAAGVADRYARWSPPPGRYLVFLAGPEEWGRWYGVHQAEWVAGYAMPITDRHTEIVLNGQRVTTNEVVDTLRHEFTHVVTLADVRRDYSKQWWLVEGIAEYVRMVGRPLSEYELLAASRRYVQAGNTTNVMELTEPPASASTEDASGRYGVAFLSVRWLAERFGEDRMLRFFDAVVRRGQSPEYAMTIELGVKWASVADECAAYVRQNLD